MPSEPNSPAHKISERELLLAVLDLPVDKRQEYIDLECRTDLSRKLRIEQLVRNSDDDDSFMAVPAPGLPPTIDTAQTRSVPVAGIQLDRYKLMEQVGEGGMGIVFVAEQLVPVRRKVAIKVIKPGMDSKQVIARFEAERQALAMMDHSNIARVFDAGTTAQGLPYFVMELVRGLPLTEYCDKVKLPTKERVKLFVSVCNAIQHAHHKGIVHRDIKPSNVLVTLHDGTPVVKVIDFGVAKALNQQLSSHTIYTALNQVIGTPLYMSPEQLELSGLDIDTRSDIYSLGVLLYELLTGQTPFDRDQLLKSGYDEMRRIIREQDPPRPSQRITSLDESSKSTAASRRAIDNRTFAGSVRGELDWITMKALEKDRGRRYATSSNFAEDLQRYLNDEPVLAFPPSVGYRVGKIVKRNRGAVMAASLVTLSVLSSLIFGTFKYFGERDARLESDRQQRIAVQNADRAEKSAVEASRERAEAVRQKAEAQNQRNVAKRNLYDSDMRLTMVDVETGNSERARKSLLTHVPAWNETDLRGWEWYHLLGRSFQAERELFGHTKPVNDVSWSPDGRFLASVSNDGSAIVWDAKNWKAVRQFSEGTTIKNSVDWSPDSKRLAWGSAANESVLRIWNSETDQVTVVTTPGIGSVWSVAWSHDGNYLATGNMNVGNTTIGPRTASVDVWNAETLEHMNSIPTESVTALDWSMDDRFLSIADGKSPKIYEIANRELVKDFSEGSARSCAWHPRETIVAFGLEDGECIVWDVERALMKQRFRAGADSILDMKWSSNANHILVSSEAGVVTFMDAESGDEVEKYIVGKGRAKVSLDPTGAYFASCSVGNELKVWRTTGSRNPLVFDTKTTRPEIAWNKENTSLFVRGQASNIFVFESKTGNKLNEVPVTLEEEQRLISFSHIGKYKPKAANYSASIHTNALPRKGDMATLVAPTTLNRREFDSGLLSSDSKRILYVPMLNGKNRDQALTPIIAELESDRVVVCHRVLEVGGASWSPDGRFVAIAGPGDFEMGGIDRWAGWVHVLDSSSGQKVCNFQVGSERVKATCVAWSHDGKRIAAGNKVGLCEVWDFDLRRKIASERMHLTDVTDIAWSSDDTRIASGGKDKQVHLWDANSGKSLLTLEPHLAEVCQLNWSPNGETLASVDVDGIVKLWDAGKGLGWVKSDSWRRLLEPREWSSLATYVNEERWTESIQVVDRIIAQGDTGVEPLCKLALIYLKMGNEPSYRETCQRLMAKAKDSQTEFDASQVVSLVSLAPGAIDNYEPAIALAQRAIRLDTNSRTHRTGLRGYHGKLGATLFRAGRFQEALQAFWEAACSPFYVLDEESRYFLAMTLHRLNQMDLAKKALEIADKAVNMVQQSGVDSPEGNEKIARQLLREEACKMLGVPIHIHPSLDASLAGDDNEIKSIEYLRLIYSLSDIGGELLFDHSDQKSIGQREIYRLAVVQRISNFADTSLPPTAHATALRKATDATQYSPKSSSTWNTLGILQFRSKSYESAIDSLKKSIAFRLPTEPSVSLEYFYIATSYYERAVKSGAQKDNGLLREAIANYEKSIGLDPSLAIAHYELGVALALNGQLDEAIASLRKSIAINPTLAIAHYELGIALSRNGQTDEAIVSLRKSIEIEPRNYYTHFQLGLRMREKGRLDEAISCYKKAIALAPNDANCQNDIGLVYLAMNQLDEAVASYKKAIEIAPRNLFAHHNLGDALVRKGQLDEAITSYQTAIAINPKFALSHVRLGLSMKRKGQLDEAIACYRKATELEPMKGDFHFLLASALRQNGRLDEAIASYRKAIEVEPTHVASHNNLGDALLAKNQVEDAVACFERCIELDPKHVIAHCNLGEQMLILERWDDAISLYKKSLELEPGSVLGRTGLASAERRVRGRDLFPAYQNGSFHPTTADEFLCLAECCRAKKRHLDATALYSRAFAVDVKLADDLQSSYRCHAACSAALSAAGQGEDAANIDEQEKARLRDQALGWLRADIQAISIQSDRDLVKNQLIYRQQITDLSSIRDELLLAKLLVDERDAFTQLWENVASAMRH